MTSEIKSPHGSVTLYVDEFNKRMRVDNYSGAPTAILDLIQQNVAPWVEKLIIKSRQTELDFFLSQGFTQEAFIPQYFAGKDMYFLSRFFTHLRSTSSKAKLEDDILIKGKSVTRQTGYPNFEIVSRATAEDTHLLAHFYASIFDVYPTPLYDPVHILKTLESGTLYAMIRENGRIASAASAEINPVLGNAELTDCATAPGAQGKGYIKLLLSFLECTLLEGNIRCLYTLARAQSAGMNRAFQQLGYTYSGRLVNNCLIYSGLEDMNVWYKNG